MTAEATEAVQDDTPDLDLILPEGGLVQVGGVKARVSRLKTREFLGLMRVITNGIGPNLGQLKLETDDEEQMKADLLALVVGAMPNAAEEFVDFLQLVLVPVSESDRAALAVEMRNPDPMDTLDVLGVLVEQEAADLAALAGKARAWVARIQASFRAQQRPAG